MYLQEINTYLIKHPQKQNLFSSQNNSRFASTQRVPKNVANEVPTIIFFSGKHIECDVSMEEISSEKRVLSE